ncbi:phosphatidyl inositol kinase (PIK-B), partial [Thraustotheca clavata]
MEPTPSMTTLVQADKQMVEAIKDELRLIEEIVTKPSKPQLSPSSKQRWRATVRQIIFMEKAKEKVLQSHGAESIERLKNTTSLSLLCSLPQLNQLEPFELMALNQQVEYKEYRSNTIVCSGTIASDRVFIVRTGVLSVRTSNSAERLQYVSGDMLDANEMLTKEPTMTVLAHCTTECYHFPRSALNEYEHKLPTTPLSTNLYSVRYNDPESESFRKWAKETVNCLQYEATENINRMSPQAFLREILLTVSPELDLDHCIHCMAQSFIRLFQAKTVRFYLVNTSSTQFHTKFSNDEFQDLHTPTNFGIPGVVYTTNISFIATNAQFDTLTIDPLMYINCGSVMASPVVLASSQQIGGVWEIINSTDKVPYTRHEIQLLELAAQFTQPYLLQCGTVTRHLGSVSEVSNDLIIKPRIVRLCTKVIKITICAGLYHGDTLLVPLVTSPVIHGTLISSTIREFECLESLVFSCNVQSLPRGAHICISICGKNNQCLAQSKYFVFSFDHYFRLGTLYLALYPSLSLPVEYHECLLGEGHTHEEYVMVEMPTSSILLTYRSSNMTWVAPQSAYIPQPVLDAKQLGIIAAFKRNPLKTLTSEDRVFFWSYRANLLTTSAALMPFLLSVNWANRSDVTEAYKYLYLWSPPTALQALQLLSPKFADPFVRAYAVRCLDSLPDY